MKFFQDALFGLAFGCGFWIAQAVLAFVGSLIAKAGH